MLSSGDQFGLRGTRCSQDVSPSLSSATIWPQGCVVEVAQIPGGEVEAVRRKRGRRDDALVVGDSKALLQQLGYAWDEHFMQLDQELGPAELPDQRRLEDRRLGALDVDEQESVAGAHHIPSQRIGGALSAQLDAFHEPVQSGEFSQQRPARRVHLVGDHAALRQAHGEAERVIAIGRAGVDDDLRPAGNHALEDRLKVVLIHADQLGVRQVLPGRNAQPLERSAEHTPFRGPLDPQRRAGKPALTGNPARHPNRMDQKRKSLFDLQRPHPQSAPKPPPA